MKERPNIVAQRLTELRDGVRLSQAKLGVQLGLRQPDIYRYENAQSFPPYGVLMKYADFFDVSLDYIFGRTDNPQGKLYEYQQKLTLENERMQDFIEMCFDPTSPANAKLKQALLKLMEEEK